MCRSDLLLLDEPTNHLDLDAIVWLEDWLRNYPGTLLLIAHDREFLDGVIDRIVRTSSTARRRLSRQLLGLRARSAPHELAEQRRCTHASRTRDPPHAEPSSSVSGPRRRKARQAQSRSRRWSGWSGSRPPHVDSPFEFSFRAPAKLPRPLSSLERQAVGYGETPVIAGLEPHAVAPGERSDCSVATAPASRR